MRSNSAWAESLLVVLTESMVAKEESCFRNHHKIYCHRGSQLYGVDISLPFPQPYRLSFLMAFSWVIV